MPGQADRFDVIILGSGIAGSMLGAILANAGVRVLLADAGVHPRFAVGESTTPQTLNMFRILARRYAIPEIETLVSYDRAVAAIGPVLGTKLHFGFLPHEDGREPDPARGVQIGTEIPSMQTSHLFRQDTDAYLFHAAIRYGCVARQAFRVTDLTLADDHVAVTGANGERFTARYLVDGSGFRSPVAEHLGLRARPCPLRHHSRSLFTHMVDVRPTDECVSTEDGPPLPWVKGTMHHVIERGWFWIIPFNNGPRSVNPLVSVGLTFDERRYPKPADLGPEEEFRSHVARYPALRRIFADAKTVRPWVSTDRLQYTSTRTVGPRWCLLSHAAGFIDPLYSRGLTNTGEVINALAYRLLRALATDRFDVGDFAYVERLQQGLIRYNDELVNCSFIAWSDFDLWNAVYRVWAAAQVPMGMHLGRALERHARTGDDGAFTDLETYDHPGLPFPGNAAYKQLFDDMVRVCDEVDRGERDAGDAGRELMKAVVASPAVLPFLGLNDPSVRYVNAGPQAFAEIGRWIATEAPAELRYLADVPRLARAAAGGGAR